MTFECRDTTRLKHHKTYISAEAILTSEQVNVLTDKITKIKLETKTYRDSLFFCQLKDAMTAVSVETENNQ